MVVSAAQQATTNRLGNIFLRHIVNAYRVNYVSSHEVAVKKVRMLRMFLQGDEVYRGST